MTIGVLGAGALGLSCALRLAQAGESVVVLEKENVPGGLAAGFPVGDTYLERFYHHLFRTDTTATALIHELGLGAGVAYLKYTRDYRTLPDETAATWLRRRMGERAYRVVWEPQLEGKFGAHKDEVALPWFWARIHCRTASLGYLRGGFHRLYARLAEEIERLGGRVGLGCEVQAIEREADGRLCVDTTTGAYHFD